MRGLLQTLLLNSRVFNLLEVLPSVNLATLEVRVYALGETRNRIIKPTPLNLYSLVSCQQPGCLKNLVVPGLWLDEASILESRCHGLKSGRNVCEDMEEHGRTRHSLSAQGTCDYRTFMNFY